MPDPEPLFASALREFEAGRYEAAARAAQEVAGGFAGTAWEGRAALLAGRAFGAAKDFKDSLAFFALAGERLPLLADYTLYLPASRFSENGMHSEAEGYYLRLAAERPDSPLVAEALVNAGEMRLLQGRHKDAVSLLSSLGNRSLSSVLAARVKYLMMACHDFLGNKDDAYREARSLWLDYPGTQQAGKAEDWLRKYRKSGRKGGKKDGKKKGGAMPEWQPAELVRRADALSAQGMRRAAAEGYAEAARGLPDGPARAEALLKAASALYSLKENKAARGAALEAMESLRPERLPDVYLLLARVYLRTGEDGAFRDILLGCAADFPGDPRSAECLYLLVAALSQDQDYASAAEIFRWLLGSCPRAGNRVEALWQLGWASYRMGDYASAVEALSLLAEEYPESSLAPQALYWWAKAMDAAGDVASGRALMDELKGRYAISFYGLLADGNPLTLGDRPGDVAHLPEPVYERPRAEPAPDDVRLRRAYELGIQGLRDRALRELRLAEGDYSRDLDGLKKLDALYESLDERRRPLELALQLYRDSIGPGKDILPADALKLIFPLGYWDSVYMGAAAYRLDPLLLCAIIREESSYNPGAVSPAGAVGLMQLMPGTAEAMCRKLDIRLAPGERLKNRDFNVPLASCYLDALLTKHGGRLVPALAEYNAGPGSLAKWVDKNPDVPDDALIESIEFRETRGYVKKVLRNYFVYKRLYGQKERAADSPPP
ncbi:MAG TPA: transglycosylase SLT domain-containing protein [Nitrospirota bacterium]|nr:transglycosylase SLT domain-containing protein [Nitrospirota bacterium]